MFVEGQQISRSGEEESGGEQRIHPSFFFQLLKLFMRSVVFMK
jgi:hypothetical protein